ncbi:hypothetical protein B0T21DRAFT_356098 [Apiosordaria backusii]|uniref:Uncharacterized protein n=1 Tax=Apiosordaria backusii TaxID=314023 RepID=A0AA40EZ43_9PEZI|nr:hypothetical protein B0T21DRAFT_356098 [Apiosordaria backusii]
MEYPMTDTPTSLVSSILRSCQPWSSVPTLLLQSDSRKWRGMNLPEDISQPHYCC